MPVRLFVGNLPYEATEAELREHFSAVGLPSYVYIPTDRETGRPRGFAFVEFTERAQAEEAIRRFNSQPFKGRPLAVNEARAKEDRPRSGPPPRPPLPRPGGAPGPSFAEPPRSPGAARDFGPDAPPRRSRNKPKKAQKSERGPKGPMREVVRGQFFGGEEEAYEEDLSGDNFASSVDDSEDEENPENQ